MKKIEIMAAISGFIVVLCLAYGAWQLARKWNYFFSYEDMVQQTVCEMIKPEHLKKPCE